MTPDSIQARLRARVEKNRYERAKAKEDEKVQHNARPSEQQQSAPVQTSAPKGPQKVDSDKFLDAYRNRHSSSTGTGSTTPPNELGGQATPQLDKTQITKDMLNPEQLQAVSMAEAGQSFCLIGPAGSGKTTTTRMVCTALHESGAIGNFRGDTEKVIIKGMPCVLVLSFTNQAVRNIRENLPSDFKGGCTTLHNVLEFHPEDVEYDVYENGVPTGETKTSQRFIPRYGKHEHGDNEQLPHVDCIVIEEAGSVPLDLFTLLWTALPNPEETIWVFLGDLQQTPPVFDDAILGFKLLELPTIELKTTYRNLGLVTQLAHRVLKGKPIQFKELDDWACKEDASGRVELVPFKKHVTPEVACVSVGTALKKLILAREFHEEDTQVLIPYNKQFGTIELNKWIAQGISERDNLPVYEVIAGYHHHYFSVGDKFLYDRTYHKIVEIVPRIDYTGKKCMPPSTAVDRWGRVARGREEEVFGNLTKAQFEADIELDDLLENVMDADADRTTSASHTIVLENLETGSRRRVRSASDVNSLLMVYAMTVHKAQGSEFQNVWLIMHSSHSALMYREILYTGITRARKNLKVLYSPRNPAKIGSCVFSKGILNQMIKGNTLEDKLKYFRDKMKAKVLAEANKGLNMKFSKEV